MIYIASTLSLSPESQEQENVDFLKKRGITPDFLFKEKILPKWANIEEFVADMLEVEGRASEMGVKLKWVGKNNGAMAFVTPDEHSETIFFNLRTLVFDSHHRGTLTHELTHLKQKWVTGNAYTPPWLDTISDRARQTLYKKAGMTNMSVRDVLEWFVEWSTAVKHGKNENVAYTHLQVPEVKKLDAFVLKKTGVSLIACYVQMTAESMSRFETALHQASNEVMLDEAAVNISWRHLSYKEKNHVHHMARYIYARGDIIKNEIEAWKIVLGTRVPETFILQWSVSERVASSLSETTKYNFWYSDVAEQNVWVNILWDVIYVTADRVVHILKENGNAANSNELPFAA